MKIRVGSAYTCYCNVIFSRNALCTTYLPVAIPKIIGHGHRAVYHVIIYNIICFVTVIYTNVCSTIVLFDEIITRGTKQHYISVRFC